MNRSIDPARARVTFRVRLATIVGNARQTRGLSKSEVGRRAGVSRQLIAQIEAAVANPSIDIADRVLAAFDLDVDLIVSDRVEIGTRDTQDAAHAILSGYVQRRLEGAGLIVQREVRVDSGRYVGWIDLLAFDPTSRTLFIIELKTRIDDLGAIERSMDWYTREATEAARRFGWEPLRTVGWLLALATDEVERRLRADRDAIRAAFPMRAEEMLRLIAEPGYAGVGVRGLALVDPHSKRRGWLIRTQLEGRRSAAPYRNYAAFIRQRSDSAGER